MVRKRGGARVKLSTSQVRPAAIVGAPRQRVCNMKGAIPKKMKLAPGTSEWMCLRVWVRNRI